MKRIRFVPFASDNPYQTLMSHALEKENMRVKGSKSPLICRATIDVLHIHWISPVRMPLYLLGILVARLRRIRVVWTVHNLMSHEGHRKTVEILLRIILGHLSDALIVHSPHLVGLIQKKYRLADTTKIHFIPHGHYQDFYPDTVNKAQSRTALGVSQTAFVYLVFGSIREYKCIDDIVAAFQAIRDTKAVLLIAGEPFTDHIHHTVRRLARTDKRIIYRPGYVPVSDVQLLMNAADVAVFSSRGTFVSGSLILAMSFGKPVIIARSPLLDYYVDEKGAFFFASGERGDLTRAMERACSQQYLGGKGQYNRRRVKQWDWHSFAKKTITAYGIQ